MRKLIIAAVVATAAMVTGANAQEAYVADDLSADGVVVDDGYVAAAATDDEADDAAIETAPATRVYGFSYGRPLNCGTYMFWDGDNCVDARLVTPESE